MFLVKIDVERREERRCTAGVGQEKSGGYPFIRQSITGVFRK